MPRPRKEPVKCINLRIPSGVKQAAERLSVKAFQSLTSWVLQAVTIALDEPIELFRINYPVDRIDGAHDSLFLEIPVSLIDRLGRMAGTRRPVEIGNTIARIIASRAGSPVSC